LLVHGIPPRQHQLPEGQLINMNNIVAPFATKLGPGQFLMGEALAMCRENLFGWILHFSFLPILSHCPAYFPRRKIFPYTNSMQVCDLDSRGFF
jgi:hypothetical protein